MSFNETTLASISLGHFAIAIRKYYAGGAPGVPVGWFWQFSLRWPKNGGYQERCWYGREHTPSVREETVYKQTMSFYQKLYGGTLKTILPIKRIQ